jgi:hypothetical protein
MRRTDLLAGIFSAIVVQCGSNELNKCREHIRSVRVCRLEFSCERILLYAYQNLNKLRSYAES